MPDTASRRFDLVVGLGNHGAKYEATRHNAGFWFVDELARRYGGSFKPAPRFFGDVAEISVGGHSLRLLKPTTFMNRSGQSVGALARFYRIAPERILIVHDEIDLSPGAVRLKVGGGHGGHNGLRDIVSQLGGGGFARVRLGVGHPGDRDQVVGYVLRRPSAEDAKAIEEAMERALEEVETVLAGRVGEAMNVLNRRESTEEPADSASRD